MSKPIVLLTTILAFVLFQHSIHIVHAETLLPPTTWYTVIWNQSDDTLHWVNSATEATSIPRPKLPGEVEGILGLDTRLHISPNGRYMMQYASIGNDRQGLGFYDFQTGEWLQTHETQLGEIFIPAARNPFNHSSSLAAIGLQSNTGWRVITFETATGNALQQLTNEHPSMALASIPANRAPSVAYIQLDEALAQWRVHIRFIQMGGNPEPTNQPFVSWILGSDSIISSNLDSFMWGFDMLPLQGRALYNLGGEQSSINTQMIGHPSETLYQQAGTMADHPRWVAGGQFMAFRLTSDVYVPMWYLGGFGSDNFIPFAPDYEDLIGTMDGFILVDLDGGEVKFSNTLAFEAFTPTLGNVIYTTDTSDFEIAYITPMGMQFTLESIAIPPNNPAVIDGPDNLQATCGTVPAPRLTVGKQARVTLDDGTPLNVRTAAAGDVIMQIPEGFVVNIVNGSVCADGYLWWELQFQSGNSTVGGWSAEGTSNGYFLEPYELGIVEELPMAPSPTPTLVLQAVPIEPTEPPMVIQPPVLQPTATQPVFQVSPSVGDGDCSNAPAVAQINVGQVATVTLNGNGTLAMRTNLTDQIPSVNIPNGSVGNVVSDPMCHGGFRMWRMTFNVNGNQVAGWVADGFGANRYLQ